jgi:hypothetical protein
VDGEFAEHAAVETAGHGRRSVLEGLTVPMRACMRVALVLVALSASVGLAGCAAIEELKEAFLRWVESEKPPSGPDLFGDELPEATPLVPAEKAPKEAPSKPSKKKDKPARKLQRPRTVALPPNKPPIPDTNEAVRPESTERQSAPSQPVGQA